MSGKTWKSAGLGLKENAGASHFYICSSLCQMFLSASGLLLTFGESYWFSAKKHVKQSRNEMAQAAKQSDALKMFNKPWEDESTSAQRLTLWRQICYHKLKTTERKEEKKCFSHFLLALRQTKYL